MKKTLLWLIVFLGFFTLVSQEVLAVSDRPLEVKYPPLPPVPAPITTAVGLPAYIRYVFIFFVGITGFIALAVLIYAGFRYLTSAGQPAILADAKNQILASLTGILILLSSWLILTEINPQLTQLEIKPLPSILPPLQAGVYLCREDTDEIAWAWDRIQIIQGMDINDPQRKPHIEQLNEYLKKIQENCWRAPTSGEIPEDFNDKIKKAYLVSSKNGPLHGAIIYDESKLSGRAAVIYTKPPPDKAGKGGVNKFDVSSIKPSSVRVFLQKRPPPDAYVELYELINFNTGYSGKKSKKYDASSTLAVTDYYGSSGYINLLNDFQYPAGKTKIESVKIEGNLIVIFFKEIQSGAWTADAILDVIIKTDSTLDDNLVDKWCWEPYSSLAVLHLYYPCPVQMVIVSGQFY